MCGIAGIVRSASLTPVDRQAVSRMAQLLHHRGPDGTGTSADQGCALAQTRLAVIGPPTCKLPVTSADGRYTLVYNGEVYNFSALQQELHVEALTDTEVVLAACLHWGRQALSQLNGMFAFFLWDRATQRGLAATDPLGIKPFFYHASPERFAFSSEAGALVESGAVPFSPAEEAIAEALIAPYFSSVTALPFAGIHRLPPGHYLELHQGRVTIAPYFRFEHAREAIPDIDEFVAAMEKGVEEAVVSSLRAEAQPGVFLSGGVDSSLLAAIAQRHGDRPVRAWTIAYEGEDAVDYSLSLIIRSADRPYAERVASQIGCAHFVVTVDEERYDEALMRTLRTNDLICAWEQEVSQHLLAEAAAQEGKAVLVGDAADETHFGYSFLLNPERIASPRRILEFFGMAPLSKRLLPDPLEYFTCKYRQFAESRGYRWRTEPEQRLAMSCLIFHLWLTRLMHNGDIHLMAHSLEGRVPFGDLRLLDLARRLPQEVGYRGGIEKWHLRRAAGRFLDAEVAWRPKSALTKNLRAGAAIHRHFARAWREWGAAIEPYIDADAVEQLATAPPPATERETGVCFRLLAVMSWFARFQRDHQGAVA